MHFITNTKDRTARICASPPPRVAFTHDNIPESHVQDEA
jgi:hypothetical protein